MYCSLQRKSVLQPAIRASCSWHALAQLAPKHFLISRIDYNPSVIWINLKNSTFLSGKLGTKTTTPIAKSVNPGLSDTAFFARFTVILSQCSFFIFPFLGPLLKYIEKKRVFTEKEASLVVKDIVSALDFLHKKGTCTVSSLDVLH